ncbi:MAG: ATPase [Chlorobi bacterium]|nr:ATPase [Chlorobiota bacterium]
MTGSINIKVRKGNGEIVVFDIAKLRKALGNSGASESDINNITRKMEPLLFEGISTKRIYRIAYSLLRKHSHEIAGRYRLKKAIMELGPSGYPFERFIAKLFEADGYDAEASVFVQGKCVRHEVDVLAQKGNKKYMVECKFHGDSRTKSDVKVALYIQSRFLDVSRKWKEEDGGGKIHKGMIVTNTRFTEDAVNFGKCVGLKVVSWDYPVGNSLKDWIDRSGYHPITSLASLRKSEKRFLLEQGIVLCRQLKKDFGILNRLRLSNVRFNNIKKEALALVGT